MNVPAGKVKRTEEKVRLAARLWAQGATWKDIRAAVGVKYIQPWRNRQEWQDELSKLNYTRPSRSELSRHHSKKPKAANGCARTRKAACAAWALECYQKGYAASDIAVALNVSDETVRRWIREQQPSAQLKHQSSNGKLPKLPKEIEIYVRSRQPRREPQEDRRKYRRVSVEGAAKSMRIRQERSKARKAKARGMRTRGHTPAEIAEALQLSLSTIYKYLK